MNKYLKGFLSSIIQLGIGFVGGLFSLNVLGAGFIFFPDITTRTDQVLIEGIGSTGAGGVIVDKIMLFVIGFLPLCYLVAILALSVLLMFFTIKLIKKTDIEKIVDAIRTDFKKGKVKDKGEINGTKSNRN